MLALVNGGTFDSATGGTFQSDTDGTFNSDIPGTFESDMGGTFKVLQSDDTHTKISQGFPKRLSWVQCDWTKGLEGADGPAAATETSWIPLLENQALTKFS